MDKNQAVLEYLQQCPAIANSSIFFNFVNAKDDDKQYVTVASDRILNRPFVDGSVQKLFTFTIIDYRSVSYQELVKTSISTNENVEEFFDIQGLVDWIADQNEVRNYPDFGTDCTIDSMWTTTDKANLNGVDTNSKPALAKYSISIQIQYIDESKMIWK